MWPMLCRWWYTKSTVGVLVAAQQNTAVEEPEEVEGESLQAVESDSSREEVFGLLPKKVCYLSFLQFLQTRVPLLEEEIDTMSTIHPLKKNHKWFSVVSSLTVPQLLWDSMNISAWLCSFTVTMSLLTAASCGAPTIAIACHRNLSEGTLHTVEMITFHPVGFWIASSRLCTHS